VDKQPLPTPSSTPVVYRDLPSKQPNASKDKALRQIKMKRKKRKSPRKIKNFEDDYENEEELERFTVTGIRTKHHTLELCRLMVRTTDHNTRMCLAGLLQGRNSPIFLQFFYLFSIFFLNCF
jgi:hypothetical protein